MAQIPNKTLYGQNARVRVFLDGVAVPGFEFATKASVTQVNVMHRRGYLDRKRDVTDKHVNGYDVTLNCDRRNGAIEAAFAARDDARDNNQPIPVVTCVITWKLRNGGIETWQYINCEDGIDTDSGERTAESTNTIKLQAEDRLRVA